MSPVSREQADVRRGPTAEPDSIGPAGQELLAKVAHELRQPLTVIVSAAHMMDRQGGGVYAGRARQVLEQQVAHLTRLLEDILEAIRLGRATIEIRRRRLDLRTAVEVAVEAIRTTAQGHDRGLDVLLPPVPVWIEADPTRVQQILSNLLSNALKHTRDGQRVWVQAERGGPNAVLTVGDAGDGIPPAALEQIFQLFGQGAGRQSPGFGIGLAVVKQLAELQGGTVQAFSEGPGHGSRFVVTLPGAVTRALFAPVA